VKDENMAMFAAAALTGILSHPEVHDQFETYAEIAENAWMYARAMMEARESC
jgi:hypothetical protein